MYIINGTTVRNPNDMNEDYVEESIVINTVRGKMVKDIRNRKKRWTLVYTTMTVSEKNAIKNIYDLQTTVTFEVTETNKTVASTNVHMDIGTTTYVKGEDYLEAFTVTLTEVD